MSRSLLLVLLGCAAAPATPRTVASPAAPIYVATCQDVSEVVLPPPSLPGATNADFREGVATATRALRCCDPNRELRGMRLTVDLIPETEELARGRLADPPSSPAEACLAEQLARWVVRPAPRSDMVRRRLSPFGPRYASSPASVRLALPPL